MRLLLSEYGEGHKEFSSEEDPQVLELDALINTKGPVTITLDIERRGDQVTIRGVVGVALVADCARCAKPVERLLEGEILAVADRRGKDLPQDEAVLEQEGSILYHDGIELCLKDLVREAILLEEPLQVLCKQDCLGLCTKCGHDLNEGTCGCSTGDADPRWEALKRLDPEDS